MYAVIKVGGKQERVKPGDVIEVEYMQVDPGSVVEFRPLVVIDDDGKAHYGKQLGQAKVVARLLGDRKGEKVRVFKYRPKTGYRRSQGHRQLLTLLEVEEVALDAERRAVKAAEEAQEAPEEEAQAAPEPAKATSGAKRGGAKRPAAKKAAGGAATASKPTAREPRKRAAEEAPPAEGPAATEPTGETPGEGRPEPA